MIDLGWSESKKEGSCSPTGTDYVERAEIGGSETQLTMIAASDWSYF